MPRSLNSAPWDIQAGREGRAFRAWMGTVTTPAATPATTAITARRPQAWIRVPAGTLIIPTSVRLTIESCGATTQGEAVLASTSNDVGNGTSSAADGAPTNRNADSTNASLCTARQLATGDVTLETGYIEHARFSWAASAVNQMFTWPVNPDDLPYLRGDASWLLYIGGNAVNFFAQFSWAEYDEAAG